MTDDKPKCAECRDDDGVVLHYDIAWPSPIRKHWAGWLHAECEAVFLARREREHERTKMNERSGP
jgi:hypothetical protein